MENATFDINRLRRSFFGVSGLYFLGIPLMLLANIVLARSLSVAEFGAFGFAIAVATVLAIPVSGGLPLLLTREIAGYVQRENWRAYRGMVFTAFVWVAGTSAVVGLGLLAWSYFSGAMPGPQMLIAFLLVPFLGLGGIRNGILKGLGRPVLAEAPVQVMQPALMITGYLALWWYGLSSTDAALWWYLTVVAAVFAVATVMLVRVQPASVRAATKALDDLPRWRKAILPFVLMSATTVLSAQIAVLMLGLFGQTEAVAQMRVAERGAQLAAFPLVFVNTILGPYFVQALDAKEPGALRRITRYSARLTLLASLPIALILIFFGKPLIALTFGAPYDAQAYLPMVILVAGQIISVALGSGAIVLTMSGREKLAVYGQVLSLALMFVAGWVLIPQYGAIGAAVSAAAAIVSAKLFFYIAVRRHLGVSTGIV